MDASDDRLAKFPNIADKQRRTYAAMMLAMDDAIGKVRQKLTSAGLDQNTLVVFISDNGGPTMPGTTTNASRNDPLRGSKRTTLEGGIRVPFIIAWPGHVKPSVCDHPVIQLDVAATALAVAGVEARPEWKLDGVNLMPWLNEQPSAPPHEALYWRFGKQMAIRSGNYKLVRYDPNADVQTGGRRQPATDARLYDLSADIGESKDLAAERPEKVKELQAKWDSWNQANVPPLWGAGKADDDGPEPGTPGAKKVMQERL
jgi:arylsulfatase A-like enzyme